MTNTLSQVWASSVLIGTINNYYISVGYPHIDYKRMYILEHKWQNAQVIDSDIVFTAEDKEEYDYLTNLSLQASKGAEEKKGIDILPDKLWTSDINTPKEDQHAFTITDNYLILSEACGELFKTFRLGKTRLQKVQIYNMGTKEPDDERFFYFIDIAEWRHYVLPEKSGKSCKTSYYQRNGYDIYSYRDAYEDPLVLTADAQYSDLDLWHDPMLSSSIFLSDDLYQALVAADMTEWWFLKPCKLDI